MGAGAVSTAAAAGGGAVAAETSVPDTLGASWMTACFFADGADCSEE
jgi:hypothetical protein